MHDTRYLNSKLILQPDAAIGHRKQAQEDFQYSRDQNASTTNSRFGRFRPCVHDREQSDVRLRPDLLVQRVNDRASNPGAAVAMKKYQAYPYVRARRSMIGHSGRTSP